MFDAFVIKKCGPSSPSGTPVTDTPIRHLESRTQTYEPEGREFESLPAHHFHLQLVAHLHNLRDFRRDATVTKM